VMVNIPYPLWVGSPAVLHWLPVNRKPLNIDLIQPSSP
jgi:hypothetical protein